MNLGFRETVAVVAGGPAGFLAAAAMRDAVAARVRAGRSDAGDTPIPGRVPPCPMP